MGKSLLYFLQVDPLNITDFCQRLYNLQYNSSTYNLIDLLVLYWDYLVLLQVKMMMPLLMI